MKKFIIVVLAATVACGLSFAQTNAKEIRKERSEINKFLVLFYFFFTILVKGICGTHKMSSPSQSNCLHMHES